MSECYMYDSPCPGPQRVNRPTRATTFVFSRGILLAATIVVYEKNSKEATSRKRTILKVRREELFEESRLIRLHFIHGSKPLGPRLFIPAYLFFRVLLILPDSASQNRFPTNDISLYLTFFSYPNQITSHFNIYAYMQ